jgi:hypothetical protein
MLAGFFSGAATLLVLLLVLLDNLDILAKSPCALDF